MLPVLLLGIQALKINNTIWHAASFFVFYLELGGIGSTLVLVLLLFDTYRKFDVNS